MLCIIFGIIVMIEIPNISASDVLQENSNDFGPYECVWDEFYLCQGPKAKNLSIVATNLVKKGESYFGYVNITFLAQARVDEIRIIVYVLKGTSKNILWSYNLKDPCQHYAFGNIIEKGLNAHNCVVNKGNYTTVINYTEMIHLFLGPSFFYGKYTMKAMLLSKKGNISCIITTLDISKKDKEIKT